MKRDGRRLEEFVAFIERTLASPNVSVRRNDKVHGEDGTQIAEFDVIVEWVEGSQRCRWLIECRDRPAKGAAPVEWVEQLIGRRFHHSFDRVTAVSTTGFSSGAKALAARAGVELRELTETESSTVVDWLACTAVQVATTHHVLNHAELHAVDAEHRAGIQKLLEELNGDSPVLRVSPADAPRSLVDVFASLVQSQPELIAELDPSGRRKAIRVCWRPEGPPPMLVTSSGDVPLSEIVFDGELFTTVETKPLEVVREYRCSDEAVQIAQTASFASIRMGGREAVIEAHRLSASGEIVVSQRVADSVD